MAKAAEKLRGGSVRMSVLSPAALLLLAFLAPGAWLLTRLPPVPVSKALTLAVVGIWLVLFGVGVVGFSRPDRRMLWGLGAVGVSVCTSYVASGSLVPVAVYDLFADMPLMQWLGFVVVFVLATGLRLSRSQLERALAWVVGAGVLVALGMIVQRTVSDVTFAFGSTAYSVTALVPLVPLAVGLAVARRGQARVFALLGGLVVAAALAFFSGSSTGLLAAGFAIVLSVAVYSTSGTSASRISRTIRSVALAVAALMTVGLLFAQIPALSGAIVNPESVAPLGKNVVSRVYMWQGAQAMVAERPVVGFGPSGYRTAAVEYLAPEALQYGADAAGNADPTVYSPQSPHSLLWEIVTRLGVLGLLAFAALFGAWIAVLRDALKRDDGTRVLRAGLAAGFVSALFALLVNPVVFPIGWFGAAAAGLAVGAMSGDKRESSTAAQRPLVWMLAVGLVVIAAAGWLYVGEWRAYSARSSDPAVLVAEYEAALRIIPGHPLTERRLLENRLILAATDAEVLAAQDAVDAAPAYMAAYAPNLVNFAAYSLTQAERSGRTDMSRERAWLTEAGSRLPTIPSLVAEQLHLAILSGDVEAVRAALPVAYAWGRPYPYTESYLQRAEELLR